MSRIGPRDVVNDEGMTRIEAAEAERHDLFAAEVERHFENVESEGRRFAMALSHIEAVYESRLRDPGEEGGTT